MSDSPAKEITRRGFITRVGHGLVAANFAGALLKGASAQQVPDPPGKKLGWAIVGLGNLAINQILPAFAKCEKSKVVALVSGHPDKANKLALRYGVTPKNIYNYQNYDSIKDNPEVDIIYIVLPNGMHAEYTIRGLQAGKHVLSEKPMANTPADPGYDPVVSYMRKLPREAAPGTKWVYKTGETDLAAARRIVASLRTSQPISVSPELFALWRVIFLALWLSNRSAALSPVRVLSR